MGGQITMKIGIVTYDATKSNVSGAQTSGPINMHNCFKEYLGVNTELYSLVMARKSHYEPDAVSSQFTELIPDEFDQLKSCDFLLYSFLISSSNRDYVSELTDELMDLDIPFAVLLNLEVDAVNDKNRTVLLKYLTNPNCKVLLTAGLADEMVENIQSVFRDTNPEVVDTISNLYTMRLFPYAPKFNKMLITKDEALAIKQDVLGFAARISTQKKPELLLRLTPYLDYPVEIHGYVNRGIGSVKLLENPLWEKVYKGPYNIENGHPNKYNWMQWAFTMTGRGRNYMFAPRYETSAVESLQMACMPFALTETIPSWSIINGETYPISVPWETMRRVNIDIEDKAKLVNDQLNRFMKLSPCERYDICEHVLNDVYEATDLENTYIKLYNDIKGWVN